MASENPDTSLDDLLSDALSDFDKKPEELIPPGVSVLENAEASQPPKETPVPQPENLQGASGGMPNVAPPADIFGQFFDKDTSEKLQQEWESAMKELLEDDPGLVEQINKIPSMLDAADDAPPEATSTSTDTAEKPVDFEEAMKATISGMKQSTDELKNMTSVSPEEKLLQDMRNMGLGGMGDMMGQTGGAEGLEGQFINLMEGMMKNLLSKDILYPTMKHISGAYPDWLESKKGEISEQDFERYKRQSGIMVKICENFESETETDSDEIKRKKLNELMNLVEEMQDCGNPPSELLDGYGSPVDASKIFGNAAVGGEAPQFNPNDVNPDNCAVM